jgi:hypothetical protein
MTAALRAPVTTELPAASAAGPPRAIGPSRQRLCHRTNALSFCAVTQTSRRGLFETGERV